MSLPDLGQHLEIGPQLRTGSTGAEYAGRMNPGGVEVLITQLAQRPGLEPLLADPTVWLGYRNERVAATLAVGLLGPERVAVFELPAGEPADQVIATRGPLPTLQALRAVRDVAVALEGAHSRGVGCGSVSSANVFLGPGGASLCRLGLTRISAQAAETRLPFGDPAYLAPEVLQVGQAVPTPGADVYALGILFFELLSGHQPYAGSVDDVLLQHLQAPLPAPALQGGLSLAVAGLLLRMTAKVPDMRLDSASAVVRIASKLLRQLPAGGGGPPASSAPVAGSPAVASPPAAPAATSGGWGAAVKRLEDTYQEQQSEWSVDVISQAAPPQDLREFAWAGASTRLSRDLFESVITPPEVETTKAPGQQLTMGKKLDRGPVGATYEGCFEDAPAVIKVVSKRFEGSGVDERLKQRCKAAKILNHPNVVRLRKMVNAKGRFLLVHEQAGRPLRGSLAQGPMPIARAVEIVQEVAKGLEAGAACALSHGDVRPEKVYLGPDGAVKLADFGLAEASCVGAGSSQHGLPFGHPDYLAPEVLQSRLREPTVTCDIYSLGILFYELITGCKPFTGDSPREVLTQHLTGRLPAPPEGVTVPGPIAELILRMTAKSPARRPQSFREVLEGLETASQPQTTLLESALESLDVDEFDPTASLNTEGDWAQLVAEAPRASNEWSHAQIEKVRSGDHSFDQADLARPPVSPLASPTNGAPQARSRPPRGDAVDRKGLISAVLGLMALGVCFAVIAVKRGGDDPPPPTTGDPGSGTKPPPVVVKPPPPTPPEPPPPEVDVRAELDALEDALDRKDLVGAAPKRLSLSQSPITDPAQRARFDKLSTRLGETVALEVEVERKQIEELLALGQVRQAAAKVKEIEAWAGANAGYQRLASKVERRLRAREQMVRELRLDAPLDVPATESALVSVLSGWGRGQSTLHSGGGFLLTYSPGDPELVDDLVPTKKRSDALRRDPASESKQVLYIKAPVGEPAIYVHRLALTRPATVGLEFMLGQRALAGARLALVCGTPEEGTAGVGVAWGLVPVRLKGDRLNELNSMPVPKLEARVPMRLVMRVDPSSRPGFFEVTGALIDYGGRKRTEGGKILVPAKDVSGRLAIFVEGTEIWLRSFEVTGILDPAPLRKRTR